MKYRILGRTEAKVSEVGFGAWAIGGTSYGKTRDGESLEALKTAWEHGVNFFDTADTYGKGHSEKLIGKFLKGKRDQAFIATKVGWDFYQRAQKRNFDPNYIRFACDESLKRLQTDRIDLYQLHNPTLEQIEQGKLFEVLDELKKNGKIRFYGISVHTPTEAMAVIHSGKSDTIQLIFNLLDQRPIAEVFPSAQRENIGIIAREPLACGLLSAKYTPGYRFPKDDHRNRWPAEKLVNEWRKIDKIQPILQTFHASLVQAALEFILSFKAVSVVIPGAKTRAQVVENVKASEEPGLRIQEISMLRELYERESIFQTGFFRN